MARVRLVTAADSQNALWTGEALLAGRALGALEAILSRPRDYDDDLSARLKSASLEALQRLSMDSVGPGIGPGQHVAPGRTSSFQLRVGSSHLFIYLSIYCFCCFPLRDFIVKVNQNCKEALIARRRWRFLFAHHWMWCSRSHQLLTLSKRIDELKT